MDFIKKKKKRYYNASKKYIEKYNSHPYFITIKKLMQHAALSKVKKDFER
jgi:hypothetical protein